MTNDLIVRRLIAARGGDLTTILAVVRTGDDGQPHVAHWPDDLGPVPSAAEIAAAVAAAEVDERPERVATVKAEAIAYMTGHFEPMTATRFASMIADPRASATLVTMLDSVNDWGDDILFRVGAFQAYTLAGATVLEPAWSPPPYTLGQIAAEWALCKAAT